MPAKVYKTARWRRLRKIVLAEPCVRCGGTADHCDHITPLNKGGEPYSLANLQPLCRSCHSRKTMIVDFPRGRRIDPLTGLVIEGKV